jgi:hypothetical protein
MCADENEESIFASASLSNYFLFVSCMSGFEYNVKLKADLQIGV